MKNVLTLVLFLGLGLSLMQCSSPQNLAGTTIQGKIENAQNMQLFLDNINIGQASTVAGKTDINGTGDFTLNFPEGLTSGIYGIRIGAKKVSLVLDGSEKNITINGDLSTLHLYDFQISGSRDSEVLRNTMQGLVKRKLSADDIDKLVDTTANPVLGAYVAFSSLGGNGRFLNTYKKALKKLESDGNQSAMATSLGQYVGIVEQQYNKQRASELVQIGQAAPDIKLPNPNGKEYALSDLKGKVVLLDFWASWCRPCRMENPNVVKVYERYKDQGFTVFSVSLDGIDSRMAGRYGNNPSGLNQAMESQKKRWVDAIKKDGLSWEYHVSDLKKWESSPAALYGVRSIPRTFMIDRDGNIAALNLRGAAAIEQELKRLL